ncbi:MAG: MATE family efflux transporter [Calditrichaceae bacterium]|nr:MATE family efflux transporter [Calditrichaceae bacterium]
MTSYKTHLKETIKLAVPVSVGQLGHVMLGATDSIMVGHVGAVPLAASSLVNGIVFLIIVFGLGMTLAITPLVSIARGREDKDQCGVILRQSLLLNSVITILLLGILLIVADMILYMNQEEAVALQAISYAKIIAFSIIPFMIFQVYRQFIEGLAFTKPAMYITLAAVLVNVFGNWVFIYGNLGLPAYGLDGAGYSTLITRSFMAATILTYVLKAQQYKQYEPSFKFRNINWPVLRELLRIGVPTGFQHFFEVGAFSFSAIMIGWLGSTQLAAHQIALSLASASFMVILGISAAGTIRVGHTYGRKNIQDVRKAGFLTTLFAASVMAFSGIIFILFRDKLPLIFTTDPDVIKTAATLIIVAALFQISDGAQAAGLGILRGITDVRIPMIITFIAYWIIALPIGYLLGFTFKMEVVGIWIGLLAGLTTAAIMLNLRFEIKTRNLGLN